MMGGPSPKARPISRTSPLTPEDNKHPEFNSSVQEADHPHSEWVAQDEEKRHSAAKRAGWLARQSHVMRQRRNLTIY